MGAAACRRRSGGYVPLAGEAAALKEPFAEGVAASSEVVERRKRRRGDEECDADGGCRTRWMCECHLTHNFFVPKVGLHMVYRGDDDAFMQQYSSELGSLASGQDLEVLREVQRQREERLQAPVQAAERAAAIRRRYRPKRPEVFNLVPEAWLTPAIRDLVAALRSGSKPTVETLKSSGLLEEIRPGLLTFDIFTTSFCDRLEDELAHFEASGLPKTAPNTMNRKGVILAELGFGPGFLEPLVSDFLEPLANLLFPDHAEGLDSYRAFTVQYDAEEGGDRELALHYDNAEVTLNVNIGGSWEGGEVEFRGLATEDESEASVARIALPRGRGLLHAGLDLHRALPLTSGRRQNLIIWCRSSKVRNRRCPMCFEAPRVVRTNRFGDEGFTVPPCRLSTAHWDNAACDLFA